MTQAARAAVVTADELRAKAAELIHLDKAGDFLDLRAEVDASLARDVARLGG